jgi:hypothetical protein
MMKKRLLLAVLFLCITVIFGSFFVWRALYAAKVEGPSMLPYMPDREHLVWLDKSNLNQNLTGKVLFYSNGTINIAHLCIKDKGETLVCQGTNPETNPYPDPEFNRSQVIGIVTGYSEYWLAELYVILFVVGLIGFILTIGWEWQKE